MVVLFHVCLICVCILQCLRLKHSVKLLFFFACEDTHYRWTPSCTEANNVHWQHPKTKTDTARARNDVFLLRNIAIGRNHTLRCSQQGERSSKTADLNFNCNRAWNFDNVLIGVRKVDNAEAFVTLASAQPNISSKFTCPWSEARCS